VTDQLNFPYIDPETGQEIVTNSMLKTFRRCPRQFYYKYVQRLKPKVEKSRPLKMGTWMHYLLEEYYAGRDWKAKHEELTKQFRELFDEEQESLGDLPTDCKQLMLSYLWHYGANKDDPHHGWDVGATEFTIETPLVGNAILRGKVDMAVHDRFGLWLVDHKNMKTFPDFSFRLLDTQSALYLWVARQEGIEAQGFIWNYLRTKAPSVPALLKDGTRLSKSKCDTDYPTLVRTIRKHELDPAPYRDWLKILKADRWEQDKVQTSHFFHRAVMEKNDDMLDRVAAEAAHTYERMTAYDWEEMDRVERVPDRSCTFMCSFTELCSAELYQGDAPFLRRQLYRIGDPMDYYQDDKGKDDKGADSA
jgi:RecB family exonuclease